MTRNLQIGVMGSAADQQLPAELVKLAEQVGAELAKAGVTTVFGAEKDIDSTSTAAARGAKGAGGLTLGITYESGLDIYDAEAADIVVTTGLVRGGGRELVLALSCDAVITLGGGSGTLNEIAVAYQSKIPVVALSGTGGWSDKLAGEYLDSRKKFKIEPAATPAEAVEKALLLARRRPGSA